MGIKVVLCTCRCVVMYTCSCVDMYAHSGIEIHACAGVGRRGVGYGEETNKSIRNNELLMLYKRHKRKEL